MMSCDPQSLIAVAKCFQCLDQKTLEQLKAYLLCQLLGGITPTPTYKVYTALLTQTLTNSPVPTVLENTLGNVVWSYAGVGIYQATLTGQLTVGKTAVSIQQLSSFGPTNILVGLQNLSVDSVMVLTYNFGGGVGQDNNLLHTLFEIRVYP